MGFANLLNKFLSSGQAGWVCLVVATLCRTMNVLFVSELGRDKIYLALQSRNFLEGNGLTISKYFTTSLETAAYDLTPMWPPGYPVLLAPFLKIFDYDVYWATTTVDILSCIAFILIVRKIAFTIGFPMAAANIVTLIAGCFDYAFIYESLPTDSSSFALFLIGLLLLLPIVQEEKIRVYKLVLASIFLFLPCTFRYSYPPLSIAIFLSIIFMGLYLKRGVLIRKGVVGLTVLSVLLVAFFTALKSSTGKAGYIVETGRGFFPENFIDWAPIGPGAFLNTFFTTSQLIRFTNMSVDQAFNFLKIVSAAMIIGFVAFFLYLFLKKKFFKEIDAFKSFLLIGFFISAATVVSLGYLSVTYRPQPGWGNYLGEPRYFMFVTLFLQMAFTGWVFLYPAWKKNVFQKVLVFVLSLSLFIEITHSIYFHAKVAMNFEKHRAATYKEADYVYFAQMIKPIINDNPGSDILIVSESDEFYPLMGSYLGQKGIYDPNNLTKTLPALKKKNIILFALYDPELPKYQRFIDEQQGKLIDRVNNVNFYRVDLLP